ncbi:hypothetical protein CVT24_003682 [Panaeolus cyanescens]|uniref:tRNA(Ile)-lysidine synthetase n=1 Tax=Panaeolus cyanescens TaxID=181874 RepID=A0A409W8F8_9AGAR|nr:hypothetical protein CVT24_003682 [Panaeolus cyanescens]
MGMTSKVISPISAREFASMMKQVWPPSGWSSSVAVANSGGPDSTCLLYLLHRYFQDPDLLPKDPPNVVSITIDHALQKSSTHMADVAEQSARSLGIRHITGRIPWGEDGYPCKPGANDPIEEQARNARYTLMYKCMKDVDANAVAFGHHMDDQVETMLMRLGRGSSIHGLAGMSMLSRRGMGVRDEEEASIRWNGYDYLNTWKIRPLLRIPKDRILATCDANQLDYVNDPTNFQPSLTIRNAIRDAVARGNVLGDDVKSPSMQRYPPHIAEQLVSINTHAQKFPSLDMYLHSGKEKLYESLEFAVNQRAESTNEVDRVLEEKRLRSPPGTICLPYNTFREIEDETVRISLVWRIMKYVSPSPWGSLRSEGHRRQESVQRLLSILCDDVAHERDVPASLSIGSRVWWRLVRVKPNGYSASVRMCSSEELAWLACRSPQPRHARHDPLNVDVTSELHFAYNDWLENGSSPIVRFVYDCRFLLTFDVSIMPMQEILQLGNLLVVPRTVWHFPQVILKSNTSDEKLTLHEDIEGEPDICTRDGNGKTRQDELRRLPGVTTNHFRPLTAA